MINLLVGLHEDRFGCRLLILITILLVNNWGKRLGIIIGREGEGGGRKQVGRIWDILLDLEVVAYYNFYV